jgi:hypothetical protein
MDVAVKRLVVNNDERVEKEFEREALTMGQLKHENILMLKGVSFRQG